ATFMAILSCGGGSPSLPPNSPLPPPPPNISISPTSAVAGSPDLTLTVMGSNFLGETHNFSQAVWSVNSSTTLLATTFVSSTQLTGVIPAAVLLNPITAKLSVQTWYFDNDTPTSVSSSVSFSVNSSAAGISAGFVPVGNMSRTRYGHTATLLTNGKLLIVGGSDETAELFDPASEGFAPT